MKSSTNTDLHWNKRAETVANDHEVNLMDVFQRELEFDAIESRLSRDMRALEVGCGNGFSTNRFRGRVGHLDAFDKSHEMVERARRSFGETNNRFIEDDVLAPNSIVGQYDCLICVRVLINLPDTEAQKLAIRNMASLVRAGGVLLLAEGFTEGFQELSALRQKVGLPPLVPSPINHYSSWADLEPTVATSFDVEATWHLGMYDYLTRVLYPYMVGPDNATHNTNFADRCHQMARAFNPDGFAHLSRLQGYVLRRRDS
jgi:SAM-dependent methyltransferase